MIGEELGGWVARMGTDVRTGANSTLIEAGAARLYSLLAVRGESQSHTNFKMVLRWSCRPCH